MKNKNSFGLVIISAACAVFWLAIGEGIVCLSGKIETGWAWVPVISAMAFYWIALLGLGLLTSETR